MLFAALVLTESSGCYNAKIRTAAHSGANAKKYTDTGVSFFWGASNTTTDAVECLHGISYAETYHPWWGEFLVGPLTAGIIVPIRKVYICAEPVAALVAPAAAAPPQIVIVQPGATPPAPAPSAK